jgi:hypothetical protein
MVSVWMNERTATDTPPWATMSTSQKPGGGLFQSSIKWLGGKRVPAVNLRIVICPDAKLRQNDIAADR